VIDRLTPAGSVYVDDGYDVVKGKDSLGRTQYVLLNKDAVDDDAPGRSGRPGQRVDAVLGNRLTARAPRHVPDQQDADHRALRPHLLPVVDRRPERLAGGARPGGRRHARAAVARAEKRAIEDTSAARKTRSRAMIFDYTKPEDAAGRVRGRAARPPPPPTAGEAQFERSAVSILTGGARARGSGSTGG
jgi:hypothetical protein